MLNPFSHPELTAFIKRRLSCSFPETIHVMVKIPRSYYVENYSNNANSQPNLNFYILSSDKQRRRRWLQAIDWVQ